MEAPKGRIKSFKRLTRGFKRRINLPRFALDHTHTHTIDHGTSLLWDPLESSGIM